MFPLDPRRDQPVEITLPEHALPLAGEVVNQEGGPVAEAQVIAISRRGETTTFAVLTTGADGRFAADLPPPTDGIMIAVDHADYVPAMEALPVRSGSRESKRTRLVLAKGLTLSGRVVSDDESPVAGVRVSVPLSAEVLPFTHATVSRDDGTFLVRGIPFGTELRVFAAAPGFLPAHVALTADQASSTDPLILRMQQAARLSVAVLSPAGAPVPGADIRARDASGQQVGPGARTLETGSATLDLPAGAYTVEVEAQGYPDAAADVAVQGRDNLVVRLTEGGRISGRVLGTDYSPIPATPLRLLPVAVDPDNPGGLFVLRDQRELRSDARGFFRAERLAAGTYLVEPVTEGVVGRVRPEPQDFSDLLYLPHAASVENVEVVLAPTVPVTFVLSSPAPVKQLLLSFVQLGESGEVDTEFPSLTADFVKGRAVVPHVAAGRYRVEAEVGEGFVVAPKTITVAPGSPATVSLEVSEGLTLSGRIQTEEGAPVVGAEVTVWCQGRRPSPYAPTADDLCQHRIITDEKGHWSVQGLRKQPYAIMGKSDLYAPAFESVDLSSSSSTRSRILTLRRGIPVDVRIEAPNGSELEGFVATLIRVESSPWGDVPFLGIQAECEPREGGCRFDRIVPGLHSLRVTAAPGPTMPEAASQEFSLQLPSQLPLTVRLSEP
jgi:hypothetical protein